MDQNFSWTKTFWVFDQFFKPDFLDQHFCGPNLFWTTIFLDKGFLGSKVFELKFVWTKNLFQGNFKDIFGSKFFLNKNILERKFVWPIFLNLTFGTNIFSCDEQLKKWRCHSVRSSVRPCVTFFSFSVFEVCSAFGMSRGCFKVFQRCFWLFEGISMKS